ncbi:MAG: heat-inducible transcriptional repressor HrcA [Chlamydiales bacterium]
MSEKKVSNKEKREQAVLLGLVELYLEKGKPVGSNTLKEERFPSLSSATIRNYFAKFETLGYLKQPHSSGGRVPTNEGIRLYATYSLTNPIPTKGRPEIKLESTKSIHTYLQMIAEELSEISGFASFFSSVRFDHDFIQEVKLVSIDSERLLSVILTDFGQILTEVLPTTGNLSSFSLKKVESYLQWRIKGGEKPRELYTDEEKEGQKLYSEIVVRYLVRYSNFSEEDVFRTGFSRLLNYPEFNDPVALAAGLSLFENTAHMRLLLNDCIREDQLSFWIGEDLAPYATSTEGCAVLAIPYKIGETRVGAIGILGSTRMPYRSLFGILQYFEGEISKTLTKTLHKYKLSFRQPRKGRPYLPDDEKNKDSIKMLEIKEKK